MSKKNSGGNLTVQYNLRWTEEMREKITQEAKKNTRSMNQEIISRLDKSLESDSNSKNNIDSILLATIEDESTTNDKDKKASFIIATALKAIATALKSLEENNQKKND